MSAPMVRGCDVAHVYHWVLRALTKACECRPKLYADGSPAPCGHRPGTTVRGLRAPLAVAVPHLEAGELRAIVVESVAFVGLDEKMLSRVALALTALENYYLAIGSAWDARRMNDMRWPVDELLRDHSRRHEDEARWRHASMWMSAWNRAFYGKTEAAHG